MSFVVASWAWAVCCRLGLGLLAGLLLRPASLGRPRRGARRRAFSGVEVPLVTHSVVVADRADGGSLRGPAGRALDRPALRARPPRGRGAGATVGSIPVCCRAQRVALALVLALLGRVLALPGYTARPRAAGFMRWRGWRRRGRGSLGKGRDSTRAPR